MAPAGCFESSPSRRAARWCATSMAPAGCFESSPSRRAIRCIFREGSPLPREPGSPASAARMAERQPACSERRPGWPQRTSGDVAEAGPSPNIPAGSSKHAPSRRSIGCIFREGSPLPREPGSPASAARMAKRQPACSERRPGWPQRTSGYVAEAGPSPDIPAGAR